MTQPTPHITRDHILSILSVLANTAEETDMERLRDIAKFLQIMLHTQEQILLNFSLSSKTFSPDDAPLTAKSTALDSVLHYLDDEDSVDEDSDLDFSQADREFLNSLFVDVADLLITSPNRRHEVQVLGSKVEGYLDEAFTVDVFTPADFELMTATFNDAKLNVIAKEVPDIRRFLEDYLLTLREKLSYEFGQEI